MTTIVEDTHWTTARLIDELIIWFRSVDVNIDDQTGHKRSKYERQAESILYKMGVYEAAPTFILYASDFVSPGTKKSLIQEFSSLDDKELDNVMRETIARLFDNINDGTYYNLNVKRRYISWEIQK
jgi:hypothetical protein